MNAETGEANCDEGDNQSLRTLSDSTVTFNIE
jgi:hypothetical protein